MIDHAAPAGAIVGERVNASLAAPPDQLPLPGDDDLLRWPLRRALAIIVATSFSLWAVIVGIVLLI